MAELSREQKKKLIKAILEVCPDHDELEMFLILETKFGKRHVNHNHDIERVIFQLIQGAEKAGELESLLTGLRNYDSIKKRKDIQELCDRLCKELQPQPFLIEPDAYNLPAVDFDSLFQQFEDGDLLSVQCALQEAFQVVYERPSRQMRPRSAAVTSLAGIQALLEYEEPVLAVRFVEYVIAELQRRRGERADWPHCLKALQRWRSHTARMFKISSFSSLTLTSKRRRGYLLVTFEMLRDDMADINVSAELYIGEALFFGQPKKSHNHCTLENVSAHLSQLILSAQEDLGSWGCSQICVELFLPDKLIESVIDVADTWQIQDLQQKHPLAFQSEDYVVRSLERIVGPRVQFVQQRLADNWCELEQCKNISVSEHFHIQATCPTSGDLSKLEAIGLSLTAEFASELGERQKILSAIINSGIPIAFWFGPENQQAPEERLETLRGALEGKTLTDFGRLARVWRNLRSQDNVRLLVDCPHRLPSLPDLDNRADEDAMVSETLSF